ncbi:MAG: ribosome small subunit-dependent GTPase A [Spirochaetes bacterium]|nr:MAG: ribosome small subunit-dependent GTPase A [Spirochaetota bacterium]
MTLEDWGWNEKRTVEFAEYKLKGWKPGRVIRPGRGIYRIAAITREGDGLGEIEEKEARLTGKALSRGETPAAGDWVAWREEGGTAVITALLTRKTVISRKVAGETSREQIMGVNVDVLFIVQALGEGRGFTPRGLERYITMAWESGCKPVVLLNKADLAEDLAADLDEAESSAPGIKILACSTVTGKGIQGLKEILPPGLTAAFIGPSGVGKSSIINAVAGTDLAEAGSVREFDNRGRHTTTHRELHRLKDGRLLLDTPGLRELQLWGREESVDTAFPEIEELANLCRFNDCRHENEPGCAVKEGIKNGSISNDRYNSWLGLRKELTWLESRQNENIRRELEQKWLNISKLNRMKKKGKEIW